MAVPETKRIVKKIQPFLTEQSTEIQIITETISLVPFMFSYFFSFWELGKQFFEMLCIPGNSIKFLCEYPNLS